MTHEAWGMVFASVTDTGSTRSVNQDTVFANRIAVSDYGQNPYLFLVADGMGGYSGGDVASKLATKAFVELFSSLASIWPEADNSKLWLSILADLVNQTNTKIIEAQTTTDLKLMGTTLTVAVIVENYLHLVHVGDSRLYHYDGERTYQITRDHSLVGELLRAGQLTPEEALHHPKRNVITQALGVAWEIEIEAKSLELTPKSRLLLCSDGLSNMVRDEEIEAVLVNDAEPEKQVEHLCNLANENGGRDNISVIIARYHKGEGSE